MRYEMCWWIGTMSRLMIDRENGVSILMSMQERRDAHIMRSPRRKCNLLKVDWRNGLYSSVTVVMRMLMRFEMIWEVDLELRLMIERKSGLSRVDIIYFGYIGTIFGSWVLTYRWWLERVFMIHSYSWRGCLNKGLILNKRMCFCSRMNNERCSCHEIEFE